MSDLVRWSNPVAADARGGITDTPIHTDTRIGNTALRIVGTGAVSSMEHVSINMAHAQAPGGDILSTARNAAGSPSGRLDANSSTVELIPGDPSSRTSLKTAERMGYVRRDGAGRWVTSSPKGEAPEGAPQAADLEGAMQEGQEQEGEEQAAPDLFDKGSEAQYGHMIADIPQPVYDRAVVKGALAVAESGSIEGIAAEVAQLMGGEPAKAAKLLQAGMKLFGEQADKALHALGADPAEFYEWARENRPRELQRAAVAQVSTRSLAGYRELAKDYFRQTQPSPQALTARGFANFHDKATGQDMVRIDGHWWQVKAAVKQGLL